MAKQQVELQVRFGAMSPQLHEQLSEYGLTAEDLELEQRLADAIVICDLHGILTTVEAHKARNRLMKKLTRLVEYHAG